MNVQRLTFAAIVLFIPCLLVLSGCKQAHEETNAGAPPAAQVTPVGDAALFSVDHPEQFPLAAATERPATSELVVTGTVTADVASRFISIAIDVVTAGVRPAVGICNAVAVPGMMVPAALAG